MDRPPPLRHHGPVTMRTRALALLACLTASALAAPSYFPYTPGAKWRYSNGETQTVGAARVVKGVTVLPLAHSFGGKVVSEDLLELRPSGVFLRGSQVGKQLTWYEPALTLYPAPPLLVGMTWQSASGRLSLAGRVVGQEAVQNSAGTFNALVVRTEVGTGAGDASAQFAYFVPGLGVVRFVGAGGQTVDLLK